MFKNMKKTESPLKLPITKNCGLRLLDEFLIHILKLHFLDLFEAEIQIIIMFRFSLVYIRVFSTRQISSL